MPARDKVASTVFAWVLTPIYPVTFMQLFSSSGRQCWCSNDNELTSLGSQQFGCQPIADQKLGKTKFNGIVRPATGTLNKPKRI